MDTRYKQFEGASVSTATKLWKQWGSALNGHGIGLDDVISQAQLTLLELLPKVDGSRTKFEQIGYVSKSLRWALFSWVKARMSDRIARTPGTIAPTDRADPVAYVEPLADEPTNQAELMDLDAAMALLDDTTKRLVLAKADGVTISQMVRDTGLARKDIASRIAKGMGTLRRNML